jgi:hypothetical protein
MAASIMLGWSFTAAMLARETTVLKPGQKLSMGAFKELVWIYHEFPLYELASRKEPTTTSTPSLCTFVKHETFGGISKDSNAAKV